MLTYCSHNRIKAGRIHCELVVLAQSDGDKPEVMGVRPGGILV
jgi:hypothetical protein